MEIHHQVHAERLHPLGHRQKCELVAVAATGVHPYAHPDSRYLIVVLQQFQTLALASITIVEYDAPLFLHRQEAHVGTLHEILDFQLDGQRLTDVREIIFGEQLPMRQSADVVVAPGRTEIIGVRLTLVLTDEADSMGGLAFQPHRLVNTFGE